MAARSRYGPTLVRGVSDIIQARMRTIGLRFQTQLAEAVGIDKANLGKQLTGERTIPIERIGEWQRALQLEGEMAEEFDLAVRLTHSDPKVRDLLARQDLELAEAIAAMRTYEVRIEEIARSVMALDEMRKRRVAQRQTPPPDPPPA